MGVEKESRSIKLANTIQNTWGVVRAVIMIDEYGYEKIPSVHERLAERRRLGKLSHIRSISGYFVESLRSEVVRARGPIGEQYIATGSDEIIE